MPFDTGDILRAAIHRNVVATLTLPGDDDSSQTYEARLLAERTDGFFVQTPPELVPALDGLIAEQGSLDVSVRLGEREIDFSSVVHSRDERHALDDKSTVDALFLKYAREVRPTQRRADYRVSLAADAPAPAKAWRISEHAILRDRPLPSLELRGRIHNICAAGLGFILPPRNGVTPHVEPEERVRIALETKEGEMVIEGRIRHFRVLADLSLAGGIEFKKHERDLAGRRARSRLTGLIGQLQRADIRRQRALADAAREAAREAAESASADEDADAEEPADQA